MTAYITVSCSKQAFTRLDQRRIFISSTSSRCALRYIESSKYVSPSRNAIPDNDQAPVCIRQTGFRVFDHKGRTSALSVALVWGDVPCDDACRSRRAPGPKQRQPTGSNSISAATNSQHFSHSRASRCSLEYREVSTGAETGRGESTGGAPDKTHVLGRSQLRRRQRQY